MPKVLLVDDDRAITTLLKTLLEMEPEGFKVQVSLMGEQAVGLAQANPPDVIMVDYHLKDMTGVELVHQFRQQPKLAQIPIVMASGLDVETEALAAGVNLFLLKPFEPSEIASIFLNLIGQ